MEKVTNLQLLQACHRMGYWAMTSLVVLALAAAVPLWIESRPGHTQGHTVSIQDIPDVQKTNTAQTRQFEVDGDRAASMEVLFVLDPNFYLCWESVQLNELSRSSLIPWLLELKDLATQTRSDPSGDPLEVHAILCSVGHTSASLDPKVLLRRSVRHILAGLRKCLSYAVARRQPPRNRGATL